MILEITYHIHAMTPMETAGREEGLVDVCCRYMRFC